jgi:hypothetical protein
MARFCTVVCVARSPFLRVFFAEFFRSLLSNFARACFHLGVWGIIIALGAVALAPVKLRAQFGDASLTLERQTLTISDVLSMAALSGNDIKLRHCIIRADSALSAPDKEAEWRARLLSSNGKDDRIYIEAKIEFDSCRMSAMKLSRFHFEKGIAFTGCVVEEYLGFEKCVIASLGISKTTVTTGVEVEGLVNFELDRCEIGSCVFASNLINSVNYERTHFTQFAYVFAPFFAPLNEFTLKQSMLDENVNFEIAGHIRSCTLSEDTVLGALSMSATILNTLVIEKSDFRGAIMYDAFNSPERATTLRWDQFAGYKLTVRDTVNGRNVTELDDYEALLKTYSFFYNIYGKNWQDDSKDECYVEMKSMQTRWLGMKYQAEPTFRNWLVWQLNVFLEIFCDYGTEPVVAIQYSLWVLLLFAAFYFIFPSQPENLSGVRFTHTFYNLASHKEERAKRLFLIQQDVRALKESHDNAPTLIRVVGAPFYYGHLAQYGLRAWFVRQSEYVQRLQQQWDNGSRLWTGVGAAAYFVSLLATAAAIRAVNASALSLNAFVTLGYGEIQAKGVARYFAVLEGAIGWFLLSIFSVSLISQILE